ncbi:YcgL domain-containing protein [Pseudomonas neustonica]|uniref:YcgL domain-containing protein EF096_17585 n=1 Tax=Pseudomonas neustonica TaxID=2487346 RepID=A0ABX9XGD4_9PSED|nr:MULTISPECIES: YcgL domain-containing protein [Pseudomonas]MBA6419510.1 YcgL domain-containing protein [Pseudomonas sp. 5Ae-yellow]ROZ81450.1 YcgL domain-containing protein [Pseudomonas neustonica]ROZ82626.1 YcgL domain-containing protein [Pseudomonas sp. SSM44]|tara:strand:- start:176 stop:469 length:294 start_codon:yes stop_codon:yes gene_type:complete
MKVLCSIYRSSKKMGMYLYVPREKGLAEVPAELKTLFGRAEHAMDLVLTEERKLAQEDIGKVLLNLREQGYHVQMPPQEDDYIVHLPDELLTRNDPV